MKIKAIHFWKLHISLDTSATKILGAYQLSKMNDFMHAVLTLKPTIHILAQSFDGHLTSSTLLLNKCDPYYSFSDFRTFTCQEYSTIEQ